MRCETSTPFGRPVVPEVYMMAKGSSTATGAAAESEAGAARAEGSAPASTTPAERRSAPQPPIAGIKSGSATTMRGPEWLST
jgi:hypothetical protein